MLDVAASRLSVRLSDHAADAAARLDAAASSAELEAAAASLILAAASDDEAAAALLEDEYARLLDVAARRLLVRLADHAADAAARTSAALLARLEAASARAIWAEAREAEADALLLDEYAALLLAE